MRISTIQSDITFCPSSLGKHLVELESNIPVFGHQYLREFHGAEMCVQVSRLPSEVKDDTSDGISAKNTLAKWLRLIVSMVSYSLTFMISL